MSTYSIQNLENDLAGILHGTTVNQVQNLYGLIDRAGRKLLSDLDPMETKRIAPIAGTVFNDVWDYAAPADLKGDRVIDIAPQVNRFPNDVWLQVYNQKFDTTKGVPWSQDMFTTLFNSGLKTLRINAPFLPPPITLDTCSAIGNWSVSGGATNLQVDNVNYVANGGSLSLNLAAGQSSGSLSETLSSPIDLSSHLNQSTLFLYTYLPTPSAVTAVTLEFGTDASNYYQVATSVTQQNTVFTTGWNLLAFPWLGATVTGSPNSANIKFLKVTWTYNSTLQTAVRLDNISSNLGSILNIEYYSKYLFSNASTGAWQENVLTDSDLVNLDTDSYNLLFNLVACLATQQVQGLDALFYDGNFFMQQYQTDLAQYKAKYKSETQLVQSSYYDMPTGGPWGNNGPTWWGN